MNSLGIYFGLKDINLVETSGKKILNNIRLPNPNLEIAGLEEKVPADLKLIALLKDALRSHRIEATEATFCISGQDLVIRTFEIPQLPQNELRGAINFEAKKYIPFKIDELDYDFQILPDKRNKTNLVLFVGIKKEILTNYTNISKQLDIKTLALEYSAFSILRFLKLSGIRDSGIIAIFCFDLNNEDEANFTVFENGFSLFSRDFVFASQAQGFEQVAAEGLIQKNDKLKNEIKVSLNYFDRKFPDKKISNIFVISGIKDLHELGPLFTEITIPVKIVDTTKLLGKNNPYSSLLVKSFAAALFKLSALKIKINLISAKIKAAKAVTIEHKQYAFLEGFKLDFRFIFLGLFFCAVVFGFGLLRRQPLKEEIITIESKRQKLSTVDVDKQDYSALTTLDVKYRKKIKAINNLIKNQIYLTSPLDAIPKALPKGLWLNNFRFNLDKKGALELALDGQVYLEDSDKELEAVNIFLSNLNKDPVFSKYFKEMSISSIDRKTEFNKNSTVFVIICKKNAEKK